jgi:hypothetical protein
MRFAFTVGFITGLYLLAWQYFDFAFVDSHERSRAPRWLVRSYACLLVVLVLICTRTISVGVDTASDALMVATGLIFGPALAPPFRLGPTGHPTSQERLRMVLDGLISGGLVKKAFAFGVFALSALIGPEWWIMLVFGIAASMLYSKTMFLALTRDESQAATHSEGLPSGRWGIACFTLLVALIPYTLSADTPLEPASWTGFVGLGLGALLPGVIR